MGPSLLWFSAFLAVLTGVGRTLCQWRRKYPKDCQLSGFEPNVFSFVGKWLSHLRFKIWISSKKWGSCFLFTSITQVFSFRRKLFSLETLAEIPARLRSATFDRVTSILLWHENANFAIIPNYLFPLMEFWKFFLFLVGRIILEG